MSDQTLPSWRPQPEPATVPKRMLLVAAALLAGVVLLGLLGWSVSRLEPHGVPVVEAETTPLKDRPTAPGGLVVPNQDETIFNRPNERRPEQVLAPGRVAPGPEVPQLLLLRQQQQAATPITPRAEAPPQAVVPEARPATAPRVVAVANGRWQVQLGALTTEAAARTAWDSALRRVPELGSRQPSVSELKREGQPSLWRLRTGGLADVAAARALCDAVKAKGGPCLTVSP